MSHPSDRSHPPTDAHDAHPHDAHPHEAHPHEAHLAHAHSHAADAPVRARIAHLAHFLPAQAPLARFVHHNTLHAFEELPFLEAVVKAAQALQTEPFLEEALYEEAVASGRIGPVDLDAALRELVSDDEHPAALPSWRGLPSRRTLRRRRLLHAVPRAEGDAVDWLLSESDLLTRLRPELAPEIRTQLETEAHGDLHTLLVTLWQRCLWLAREVKPEAPRLVRMRDRLVAATGLDPDERANELLVRFVAAYVDQGVAYWPMPERDGLWSTFRRVHGAGAHSPWASSLPRELATDRDPEAQLRFELEQAAIAEADVDAWLHETLQALAGWAGMVHQLEAHPELAPSDVPPISLLDFVALRALLDRLAALDTARRAGLPSTHLRALAEHLDTLPVTPPDPRGLALELFVAAQRNGLGPKELAQGSIARAFADEVVRFDSVTRRATYHLAYEHQLRVRALDALVTRSTRRIADPEAPLVQMLLCIDEREESFRRHLEEVEPRVATYGYAGNFDVMMSYEGHGAPHPVPLCPPVITPRHRVREVPRGDIGRARVQTLAAQRHVASRTLVRGGFVALAGVTRTVPLVLRTLFPGGAERLASLPSRMLTRSVPTELLLTRADHEGPSKDGLFDGYTLDEQTTIVGDVLRSIGLVRGFAELVIVVGHGSTSVNNPHAAAYNCGACAGGRSGPNGRALAQMANHPEVRRRLAASGLVIPDTTAFLGAYHDTATDAFECFDVDRLSPSQRARLDEVTAMALRAGERDAHERCRRFPDEPLDMSPARALRHAQARTVDLAQPRPEYCHATNAIAVVGRRSLSRGLFLDRRSFLISYDPTLDDDRSSTLERLLAQVGPVGAGINLEYFFSRVDQARYGSGTKLPHNITGLLGVMDGHGSDLRTGLHWQTVELHEPVRLLLVVESTPEALLAIAARNPIVQRLVVGRWVLLAAIDPETGEAQFLETDGFHRHEVTHVPPTATDSTSHYRGHREHLPFATIESTSGATVDAKLDPSRRSSVAPSAESSR